MCRIHTADRKTNTDTEQTMNTSTIKQQTMNLVEITNDLSVRKIRTNPRVLDILAQIPKDK